MDLHRGVDWLCCSSLLRPATNNTAESTNRHAGPVGTRGPSRRAIYIWALDLGASSSWRGAIMTEFACWRPTDTDNLTVTNWLTEQRFGPLFTGAECRRGSSTCTLYMMGHPSAGAFNYCVMWFTRRLPGRLDCLAACSQREGSV